jgi:hypothetical protein
VSVEINYSIFQQDNTLGFDKESVVSLRTLVIPVGCEDAIITSLEADHSHTNYGTIGD